MMLVLAMATSPRRPAPTRPAPAAEPPPGRTYLVLLHREACKAAEQLRLFDASTPPRAAGDPSRGGQLVEVVRIHRNGRRVRHWVRPGADSTFHERHGGQHNPVEGREGEMAASRRYEQRADVSRIWRMEAESAYSGLLPVVAVREAAQNGIDAIRKALRRREIERGEFAVTWDRDNERITIADNGVGMDRETLQDKFLTLGATGKGDEAAAVGGFGVAKAAILGCPDFEAGGGWEIRTRDVRLTNEMLGRDLDPGEDVAEHVQGVRITLDKPQIKWSSRGDFEVQTVELLASSDLGRGITARFDSRPIRPMWQGQRGRNVDLSGIPWPEGTQARITRFKVPPGANRQGRAYIRVGGLTQWVDDFYATRGSPHDYVVDLDITARPGSREYPLAKSRQAFQGQASNAWYRVKSAIESELQADDSQKREKEIEVFDVDADGRVRTKGGAQGQRLLEEEPEDLAHVIEGMGGAAGLRELAELARSVSGQIPGDARGTDEDDTVPPLEDGSVLGTLMRALDQAGGDVGAIRGAGAPPTTTAAISHEEYQRYATAGRIAAGPGPDVHAVVVDHGPRAGEIVHVSGHPGEVLHRRAAFEDLPHEYGMPAISEQEYEALAGIERDRGADGRGVPVYVRGGYGTGHVWRPPEEVAGFLRERRAPGAQEPDEIVATGGGPPGGRREARPIEGPQEVVRDAVRGIHGQVRTGIPFMILRNNKGWSARRRLNMRKVAPHLVIWDTAVRAVANAYGLRDELKTGLVLDEGANALHAVERGAHGILVNPDFMREAIGPKVDAHTSAIQIHNIICHELSHNRQGQHDEDFVTYTEEMRRRTAHVVPVIQQIVERVTGRKGTATAARERLEREVAQAKERARQQRTESRARIRALEAEVKRLQAEIAAAPRPAASPPTPAPAPRASPPKAPQATATAPGPAQVGLFGGAEPAGRRPRGRPRTPDGQLGFGFKGGWCRIRLPRGVGAVAVEWRRSACR